MKRRLGLLLSIGLIAMLAIAACGDDDNGNGNGDGGGNGTSFDMKMDEFLFDPDSITVSAGDEVTVNLENVGNQHHDFVIDEWGVDAEADPGESTTATFTVPDDASGDYTFYCSVPGHREAGMEGTVTVN